MCAWFISFRCSSPYYRRPRTDVAVSCWRETLSVLNLSDVIHTDIGKRWEQCNFRQTRNKRKNTFFFFLLKTFVTGDQSQPMWSQWQNDRAHSGEPVENSSPTRNCGFSSIENRNAVLIVSFLFGYQRAGCARKIRVPASTIDFIKKNILDRFDKRFALVLPQRCRNASDLFLVVRPSLPHSPWRF